MSHDQHFTLPAEQPKHEAMLCIRLTEEEHRRIHDFARQHNLQVSRLVRHFVLQAIQHHAERNAGESG